MKVEKGVVLMKNIIQDVNFMQAGTMCFGDLYIEDGFVERIDYKTPKPLSNFVIPGFVDMHTHGFRGISCECEDPKQLQQLAIEYAKRGTVGFVATLDPVDFKQCEAIFAAYREAFKGEYYGARFYGIHMEGPYLNPAKANDLDPHTLKQIDLQELEEFLWKYSDLIKVMSIAPELTNGQEAIKMLHRFGIRVSLGHTICTYEEAMEAIANGASQVTHLCNAMNDISHKQSGIIDAIFLSDVLCELNMDGVHVQKPMLKWLIQLLGSKRIMAISDGSSFSGFDYPDGFLLDEHHVVKNNAIYCHNALSSSFKDLLDAFQFLWKEMQLPLQDCVDMTSGNASRALQTLTYEIGLGKKVDFLVLDHNGELSDVIIQGRSSL